MCWNTIQNTRCGKCHRYHDTKVLHEPCKEVSSADFGKCSMGVHFRDGLVEVECHVCRNLRERMGEGKAGAYEYGWGRESKKYYDEDKEEEMLEEMEMESKNKEN